jgi:hypothetical protein
MYLPVVTYDAAASYVMGFDAALNGGLLLGFREWLIPQLDMGNNLGWPALVFEFVSRQGDIAKEKSSGVDQGHVVVEALFTIIENFVQAHSQRGGTRRIFVAYDQWLRRQEWYGPSSADWLPPME